MKNLLTIIFLLSTIVLAKAQDVIIKRNGDEIKARVLTVTASDIKFKKYDNIGGPDIYLPKGEVFMITYENGSKEVMPQTQPAPVKQPKPQLVESPLASNSTPKQETVKLGGPRIGLTYIGAGKSRDMLKETFDANPVISQFGWQFETRFFTTPEGTSGMVEFIPLIGGLEQGLFLPSLSGLIALREKGGYEFGIGPNISLAGAALVLAAGTSFRAGGVNFPVNLAVVPSKGGIRYSLVVGFNVAR